MPKTNVELAMQLKELTEARLAAVKKEKEVREQLERRCYDMSEEERVQITSITGEVGFIFLHAKVR